MNTTKITTRTLALSLMACLFMLVCSRHGTAQTTSPKQLSLSFDEAFTLGGETSTDAGYFLPSPYQIRTDSEQNIYIAEGQQKTIMVFNTKGKYLRSVGRSGKGPGEFPTGPRFILNNDDEISALDLQSKRITWFSKRGNILQEYAPAEAGMIWSRKFLQTADNNYIMLKKPRDIGDDSPNSYRTKLLHRYDQSFKHRIDSFGNFGDLWPKAGSKFVKMISNRMNGGHLEMTAENKLWYAPGIYAGKIYEFTKVNDEWRRSNTFEGRLNFVQAVQVNVGPDEGGMAINTYVDGGRQRSAGKINSYSLGLLQVTDGRMLHFSGQRMQNQDSLQTMVEVFSPQGELIGTGPFDEIAIPRNLGYFSSKGPAIWMDDDNRFYFIDNRDIPVVRVGRIEGL